MLNHHQQHSISSQSSGFASLLSEDLSNLIHQQEHQEEELRCKLAEKKQQHYFVLIGAAKDSASQMIKGQGGEGREIRFVQADLEARAWQAKARAKEAVAAALQAQLQQGIITILNAMYNDSQKFQVLTDKAF
ncbi:hypothetical protein Ccrd_025193 [Cynara cardunculus var. scolymus]|uniref:Uncharacterized protein n=1 Tax=Cynara cardunculus var. scolymus TaxID=59895 RepID=A0A103XB84_CYNCS|nr:hypothetical protein Ccrd_025193 [Cynara cardunculus var. scolymus]